MKETAHWSSGGVCIVCPQCVLMSACPLQSYYIPQMRGGLSTVSASQGPPTDHHHPASDKATAKPTHYLYRCTSCAKWRFRGASCGQWSTVRCCPCERPSCFSLSQLPFEVLFCPSDIWVCRNTGEEKIWFKCNFYQVTCLLQSAALIAISETGCKVLFCSSFFVCSKKKRKRKTFPASMYITEKCFMQLNGAEVQHKSIL